jgi:hypothetical protein
MKTISNKPQERAIIGILQDAIIWRRVSEKIADIINAFNPKSFINDFDADSKYQSYVNAFYVMGIHDNDDLCSELTEIFFNFSGEQNPANELAETIYIEWLLCLKNYCATLKTAV